MNRDTACRSASTPHNDALRAAKVESAIDGARYITRVDASEEKPQHASSAVTAAQSAGGVAVIGGAAAAPVVRGDRTASRLPAGADR